MSDYDLYFDEIIEAGREMYKKGLIVGTDGNLSSRLPDGKIAITGSGYCKGKLERENISVVDLRGGLISGPKPARDIRMHLAVYRSREGAHAVVHAHPPVVTGFSATHYDFGKVIFPEALFNLNGIVFTDYAVPISVDVSRKVTQALLSNPNAEAVILANHGALTFADSVMSAFYKMETVEMLSKSVLVSVLLGSTRYLNGQELETVDKLLAGVSPDELVPPDENGL